MNRIQEVLMRRDDMTEYEAAIEMDYVREEMMSIIETGNFESAEDFFMDNLGLEMDYFDDLIG